MGCSCVVRGTGWAGMSSVWVDGMIFVRGEKGNGKGRKGERLVRWAAVQKRNRVTCVAAGCTDMGAEGMLGHGMLLSPRAWQV